MTDENNGLLAPVWEAIRTLQADQADIERELAEAGRVLQLGPGLRLHGDAKQRAAYFGALAQAQAAYAPIERTRTVEVVPREGRAYTFDYAPLEEVISATRPALTAAGLAYSSYIADGEKGPELHTLLSHVDGGFVHMVEALPHVEKPQQMGSALTYHRRYQYQCLTGTSPEYDDDGNEASGNKVQGMQQRNRQPPAPAPRSAPAPAATKPATTRTAPTQAARPASAPPPAATPPKPAPVPAPAEEPPPPRDEDAPTNDPTEILPDKSPEPEQPDPGLAEASQEQANIIRDLCLRALRWDRNKLNAFIADRITPGRVFTELTFAEAAALIPMLEKQAASNA